MGKRRAIVPEGAFAAGPYSPAMRAGDTIYVSGQIPLDPKTGALRKGGAAEQCRFVFNNIKTIVQTAGCGLDQAVKIEISLVDLADFQAVNEVMKEFFSPPYPARACVQVAALPLGASIEIEAIFHAPQAG